MKIFGKDLFKHKKDAVSMYDFAKFGWAKTYPQSIDMWTSTTAVYDVNSTTTNEVKAPTGPQKKSMTAKEVYKCEALNKNKFSFGVDAKYITKVVEELNAKLNLYPTHKKEKRGENYLGSPEGGATHYGKEELLSMIERMENRRQINKFKTVFEKYPYTNSTLIGKVLSENKALRCKLANDFVPDFPSDAVKSMKEYNDMCVDLCNKKTNFYVIANQEDFGEVNRRRDPILLAQSPFGFFWQILGAWDETMIYLGDL